MSIPVPGIRDVNIVIEDSCNCGCLPCSRRPKSPIKNSKETQKVEAVAKRSWVQRLFSNKYTSATDPS